MEKTVFTGKHAHFTAKILFLDFLEYFPEKLAKKGKTGYLTE